MTWKNQFGLYTEAAASSEKDVCCLWEALSWAGAWVRWYLLLWQLWVQNWVDLYFKMPSLAFFLLGSQGGSGEEIQHLICSFQSEMRHSQIKERSYPSPARRAAVGRARVTVVTWTAAVLGSPSTEECDSAAGLCCVFHPQCAFTILKNRFSKDAIATQVDGVVCYRIHSAVSAFTVVCCCRKLRIITL